MARGLRSGGVRAELARDLTARQARVIEAWREGSRVYLLAESPRGPLFARQLEGPDAEHVLDHEVAAREVVGAEGPLRSPPVLARGASWLVEQGIRGQAWEGPQAMDVAAAAAERIAVLELPEGRRGPPHPFGTVRRRLRLAASTLPITDLIRARRILTELSLPIVTGHGDFHPGNAMLSGGAAWVVDWELSGRYPAGYDLMQFWAGVDRPSDRTRLFALTVDAIGERYRRDLLRLRYALAVRTVANTLTTAIRVPGAPHGSEAARPLLAQLPALRTEAGLR